MKSSSKLLTISVATLLGLSGIAPALTANASTVKTASRSYQNSKVKTNYRYAKKMVAENKTGLSGKTTALFSRKANPTTGAAAGYADLLVGLKGWGYKFTTTQKKRIASNLVINSKSTAADYANAIQGLKAVGINPMKFTPAGAKKTVNLVSGLYRQSMSKQTPNVKSQVLLALTMSSTFKRPSNAKFSKTSLATSLVKDQQKNNGWAYNNQAASVDSDTASMAIAALAHSKSSLSTVKSALAKGQAYLKNNVTTSGAYGYVFNGKTVANANSTAEAIIALSSKKATVKYVNGYFTKNQAASPLRAMLGYINKTGSIKGATSQLIGVGQVNLATAAYRQALKGHSIYTIK